MGLLAGCSPGITEGRVYNKVHHPEDVQIYLMPIVVSNGNSTTTTMVPMTQYYPETWEIDIKQYSKEEKKYLTEDFYVSKEVYDSVKEGTYFKFEDNMGDSDRPLEEHEASEHEQEKYEVKEEK